MTTVVELRKGGKLALARALSEIESNFLTDDVARFLDSAVGNAVGNVVGLTGPPGVGKSTLTNSLIGEWRKQGKSVGVVAVDPSSKLSGGALLGDRTRLTTDPQDDKIFVRSMAARDRLGGISDISIATIALMRACMDRIIVETVGIGQSEADVTMVADSILLCVQPGSGDSLQFMKAGLMELPDVVAVTKADMESLANRSRADVEGALTLAISREKNWNVPVEMVSAKTGKNVDKLLAQIESHLKFLRSNDALESIRKKQCEMWLKDFVQRRFGMEGTNRLRGQSLEYLGPDKPFQNMKVAENFLNER